MTEDKDDTIPKDIDSDYSLPGRLEESNSEYYDEIPVKPKLKNRKILVIIISTMIVSSGFFSYYFMNQNEIDSRIMQNAFNVEPEKKLINQYDVGEYGSEHSHAAIAIFLDDEQLNFALPKFQLSSKYIHFENHNQYLIHKHATNVPLEMLFTSFGMKITPDCIILNYELTDIQNNQFCTDQGRSLVFYVNGEKYQDISKYVLDHNDRILIFLGNAESISKHLAYLESLKIPDIPKKTPQYSGRDISI